MPSDRAIELVQDEFPDIVTSWLYRFADMIDRERADAVREERVRILDDARRILTYYTERRALEEMVRTLEYDMHCDDAESEEGGAGG